MRDHEVDFTDRILTTGGTVTVASNATEGLVADDF